MKDLLLVFVVSAIGAELGFPKVNSGCFQPDIVVGMSATSERWKEVSDRFRVAVERGDLPNLRV